MENGQIKVVNKIESLQFLRGIAVLAVIIYHIRGYTIIVGSDVGTLYDYVP